MMNRLICMIVILIPKIILRSPFKHIRQIGQDFLTPPHHLHHTFYIVRNEPTLLVGITLRTAISFRQSSRFGQRLELPSLVARSEPAGIGIIDGRITPSSCFKTIFIGFLTQPFGQTCHTPITVSIFQCVGNGSGGVTFLIIAEQTGGIQGIAIGFLHVIRADSFGIGIAQNRNGRIAQHTIRIGIQQFPTLQILFSALFCNLHQRVNLVVYQSRIDYCL